jgi:glycosyltransferase involved in cell wall biosynthesis
MRVLFVSQLLPYPLDSGSKVRNYYLLRHLSQRHQVTLVSFVRTTQEADLADKLRPLCEVVHTVPLRRSRPRDVSFLIRSFLRSRPFLVERDWSPALARLVQRLHQEHPFDIVQVSPLTMAPYALALPGVRRVVDCHDVISTLTSRAEPALPRCLRPLARIEAQRLSSYEPQTLRRMDCTLVVSEPDRSTLERLGVPPERLAVVPIGVDTDLPLVRGEQGGSPAILHLGGLNYPPNLEGLRWFLSQILPCILAQLPDCRLYVVGRDPPRDVMEVGARDRRVSVVGRAPDVEPYLAGASLLAVPLLSGSGMRVKILEAFARGVPVVSTTLGYEGIEAVPGEHLLVADDPGDFADAVVRLAGDELLARRLTKNARRLAEEKYGWRCVGQALDGVYDDLSSGRVLRLPSPAQMGFAS